MSIVRNFNLYLNAGNGSAPYINVNQYDQGEQWVFTLYKEDGTKYMPSTGAIVGIKADNRGIINTGTVDADGRVVINETQQMTAAAGIAIFELLIDGDSHGTANFLVNVEQRPGDNADLSDSDLSLIQQAVNSAAVIVHVIGDGDPSEVIGEHVDAWLDAHPEATTTVLDGAITAPKINQSLWDKLLVSESASGNPASFSDGADDVPVSSLKVSLEPIQAGTGDPSPSNIRPISGHSSVTVERTGKNLFDIADIIPQTHYNTDGVLEAQQYRCSTPLIPISGSLALKWSTNLTGVNAIVIQFDSNKQMLRRDIPTATNNGFVYGLSSECRYVGISFYPSAGNINTDGGLYDVLVAEGTDNTYEPYIDTSYPYILGQSVYGGTVDLATGVLTVDRVGVSLNDPTKWVNSTYTTVDFDYTVNFSDRKKTDDSYAGLICSYVPANNMQANYCRWYSASGNKFGIKTDGTLTLEQIKSDASAGNIFISYPLATPQTIQLTPTEVKTLLGYNNISSTGTVDVIYHADTKLYVDKMTSVDNNIIAPTEEGFTATRNYTVNDLLIINNVLYKVTANIARGSAITPNSNVQQTTLSALIKALS